ncbi:hypothetical protein [Paenibacillus swuensis]|uniref:hypothetical protein n=1 Tax=Paenibacillus swuensis TaxID=1178515 RepID=UPI0008391DA0|nr:hypothetical protein [Paenibacillus swuensis]
MHYNAIMFEFADELSAHKAYDTLTELDYSAVFHEGAQTPSLHLHLHEDDLASALQITQAYGGRLVEQSNGLTDAGVNDAAYNLHGIAPYVHSADQRLPDEDEDENQIVIPAHIVNEDLGEDYISGDSDNTLQSREDGEYMPYEESYDYLSGDVHA